MKRKTQLLQQLFGICVLGFFVVSPFVHAADLTSTSFIVRDPLVGTGGGYGTSASFASYLSGDMTAIGRGTSASFEGREGFLWYPYVTQGVFSVVANGADADLTWGASSAGLGWSVSGYNTGKASVIGGPYTYTSVGNVTSYSYTGLFPGPYCFVLQTLDAFSNVIATSAEQCITIQPALTFANDDATIGFGTLSSSSARFATGNQLGSASFVTAHTMTMSSNAPSGFTLTYQGATLTSGAHTITPEPGVTSLLNGYPGTSEFGISASATSGTCSINADYTSGDPNYKFVANSTETLASASGVDDCTVDVTYLANISPTDAAGTYSTAITYVLTGDF